MVEIIPVILEKKIFKDFVKVISLFCKNLPLEQGRALHLNKLESYSTNVFLCHVWLKLSLWFWIRFLKFRWCIFAILLLSPLGKGQSPSFEQTWIYSTKRYFVPSLVEIGPVVLKKILKFRQYIFTLLLLSPLEKGCGPSLEQTWISFTQGWFKCEKFEENENDNDGQQTNCDQKSSLEPSSQVS